MRRRLLEPYVLAVEQLYDRSCDDLRSLFEAVAVRRPDLLERSLFAERARRTSEFEKVLHSAQAEIRQMERTATLPLDIEAWDFGNLRLNHATGRLHLGCSHTSVELFPES